MDGYRSRWNPDATRRRYRLTESENLPSVMSERKLLTANSSPINLVEPAGFWALSCECVTRDPDGLTELDRVWNAARDLVREGIWLQATCYTPGSGGVVRSRTRTYSTALVCCFVENYSELESVVSSAEEFRKRVDYPYVMYLKTNRTVGEYRRETSTKYMYCVDGDLYEYVSKKYKLVRFGRRNW